jgi:hypothetical protein
MPDGGGAGALEISELVRSLRASYASLDLEAAEATLRQIRREDPELARDLVGELDPRKAKQSEKDRNRAKRHREVRPKTINVSRMTKRDMELGRMLYPETYDAPRTWGECESFRGMDKTGKLRPCCFVRCRYNLYLDVEPNGSIKVRFPDIGPEEMVDSCAIEVASRGRHRLEEVGRLTNTTKERARQVENAAVEKVRNSIRAMDLIDDFMEPKRRLPVVK